MILYLKDWQDYPSAIVDITTKNTSFLELAALYRDMGVKNHAFPLALVDPDLQGIDPHTPELDEETMARIAVECKINPWYYFREVARIPGRGSPVPTKFRANRGNIALYWLFFNHITAILIQIRQTGKSVSVDTLNVYLMNICVSHTTIALLTKDDALRSFNLERLKGIQMELPPYLNQKTAADIGNTEMMTIKRLKNEFRAMVPQKSPKMALNVGRGITVPVMEFDEAAFTANIGISMPAALGAGTAVRDIARQNGDPYGTIITTTAGKKDDPDGRFIYNLVQTAAVWSEKFLDCIDQEDLEKIIRQNSSRAMEQAGFDKSKSNRGSLRVNCTFNHRQLGYTDEWLRQAIEDAVGTGEDIERDFFNKWTSGSQSSPLTTDLTDAIRNSQTEPLFTEIAEPFGYVTRWYVAEKDIPRLAATSKWIMGVDSSDAAGGDDIGMNIRDIETGAVIATGNYNETNLITFSQWLLSWLIKFDNITLIVERRSSGVMILDYLLLMLVANNINPFKRLYNTVVQNYEEDRTSFDEVTRTAHVSLNELIVKYKKSFGFATSATGATSRTELYSQTLLNSAKYTANEVRDMLLINQILGLVIRNGRVDHGEGEHDDLVIAWLLTYWLMSRGKRLDYYGIDSRKILASNLVRNKDLVNSSDYDLQEQAFVKNAIDSLVEQIKKEKDIYVIQKLENQLKAVYRRYKAPEGDTMAIDDLIRELREFRRDNRPALQPSGYSNSPYSRYNTRYR